MAGINITRWLVGGVTAGIVLWMLEGAASMFYMSDLQASMQAHDLSLEMTGGVLAVSFLASLLLGLTLIFFYTAIRPRFGPGPKTAVIVAVAFWVGGYVVWLMGYQLLGLLPAGTLALWGLLGLVEMVVAALAGAWMYREY